MIEVGDTVVLDTETLAKDKRSLVVTLSAVRFNRSDNGIPIVVEDGQLLYSGKNMLDLKLNVAEQLLAGRTVDPLTVDWWNRQNHKARLQLVERPDLQMKAKEALTMLAEFIDGAQVYCRGTDFDPPILASLYADFGMEVPWRYNEVRDVRTYIDALSGGTKGYLSGWEKPAWFVAHNSLHDCLRDALQMQKAVAR